MLLYVKEKDREELRKWIGKIVHVKLYGISEDELELDFLEGPDCLCIQYVHVDLYEKKEGE